jgi:hypothetical protein
MNDFREITEKTLGQIVIEIGTRLVQPGLIGITFSKPQVIFAAFEELEETANPDYRGASRVVLTEQNLEDCLTSSQAPAMH